MKKYYLICCLFLTTMSYASDLNPNARSFEPEKPFSEIVKQIMKSSNDFQPIENLLYYDPSITESYLESIKVQAQKAEKISHLYAQTYNPYLTSDLQDLEKNTLPWSFNSAFRSPAAKP